MPGLAQRNDQFSNGSSPIYSLSSSNGFWSKHRDDVSYNQLQKFWSDLSPQARQKLLRIGKQTLFEQARKNMYCSRCNGLLLEGFLQIVIYGKSLKQEETCGQLSCNRSRASKNQKDGGSSITNGCHDEIPDPSVHPWGGLTITREGSLTLIDCYLYCKSLKGLQNVFDSARARERERELLYPDACGGGGRGWISQGMASYGRGHGTRETCALHTARLSCDTLVDFWSALGEETRHSLLRMKEEDFIERLMYRFDSKRFCRDCRRNVIREFKELKELKRLRREPRCTNWFCVADTAFQYEVSDGTVQADWRHTFADTVGTYHHFEWAVGTGEGKSDILEFENVGMNGSVKVNGLDLGGLSACYITLRAWKLDGRCTELSVKAHALKGQECVHCRLIVGDGYVTITRGESIRRFFEHAEEAEEEEDDDFMDKDGNELDGECSRPQKHAKSPELAREFLLDAATVIFKEQVEKAFREGTARQNAHSIFVCLALKLLEERVHVACKDIITLEKQMKLLEEEEKEKREEEERKERRRTKEKEKKLRRKERLKGKEKDKDMECSEVNETPALYVVSKEESSLNADEELNSSFSCKDSVSEADDQILSRPGSPEIPDDQFQNDFIVSKSEDHCYDSLDGENINGRCDTGSFIVEQSKFSRRRLKFRREAQLDASLKWSDRRRYAAVSDSASSAVSISESRCNADNFETPSRGINGSNRQLRVNAPKSNGRHSGLKFTEKFLSPSNRMSDRYNFNSCSCNKNTEYRAKVEVHVSAARVGWETKTASKSESALDASKQFYRGNRYDQVGDMQVSCVRPKSKVNSGDNPNRDMVHPKKIWEPMYPRSNSDSDVTLRSSAFKDDDKIMKSCGDICTGEDGVDTGDIDEDKNLKESRKSGTRMDVNSQSGFHGGAQDSCNSTKATYEEIGLCPVSSVLSSIDSASNGTSDPTVSSTSNSDNCSSCLSEGDSNTTSSNHGHQESSSTSDSEDASQQSGRKETSVFIQNGFRERHEVGMENNQNAKSGESMESRTPIGPSLSGAGSNIFGNPSTKVAQSFDNGLSAVKVGSQHHGMLSPMHNQNVQFPMFQGPSTMGYYHQSPVSWPAAPANGMLTFPNHYLYAGPLGYGINGNSGICMQYPVQHVPPLFTPGPVPIYQPVINREEQTQISTPSVQDSPSEANTESVDPSGAYSRQAPPTGERAHVDNSGKLHTNSDGFSLFHYGGPVANPPGYMPSEEQSVADSPLKCSDHVENDQACYKKEATIEEYNLFAASNGIRFQFF